MKNIYKVNEEAVKKIAERVYDNGSTVINRNDLEEMFPELQSKDEQMRKKCIELIKELKTFCMRDGQEECIAWLEKQGENISLPKFTFDDVLALQCCMETVKKVQEDKELYEQLQSLHDRLHDAYWLKKQGEVEPKFEIEEGKWYVCIRDLLDNYANKAFCKGDIYLSTQNGSLIPSNSNVPFEVVCPDTYFKDWTIQDAKDGDVLSYRDGQWIFIYKEKIDDSSFYYHTLYSTIHQDLTINDSAFTLLDDAIIPATKKQRDLLFQTMKKFGYVWDAEKKEVEED